MDKKELRANYKEKRKAFSPKQLDELSVQIIENCIQEFDFGAYQAVHMFLPIVKANEINTNILLQRLSTQFPFMKICVPRSDFETGTLEHVILTHDSVILENKQGIPEPLNGRIYKGKYELVFVPLLAVDKYGHRVGYGKGFYDRFLATQPTTTLKVGLSLFEPIDEIEDKDEHDVALNKCVTPSKIYSF